MEGGGSEIQGYPWLPSEFKASLGYPVSSKAKSNYCMITFHMVNICLQFPMRLHSSLLGVVVSTAILTTYNQLGRVCQREVIYLGLASGVSVRDLSYVT